MPAPSLRSSAVRACIRHLPNIDSVGDIPYEVLRPVLKHIRNPDQLHQLEEQSPHIADADAELWRAFIARDIPNWQDKMMEPKNPRSWWKVYRKLIREEAQAKEEQEAKLREAMKEVSKSKEKHTVGWSDKILQVNEPRRPWVDGVIHPFANSRGVVRIPAPKKSIISAMRAQSRQAVKTRDYNTGKIPVGLKKIVAAPKNQIKAAPEWMVREHKRPPPPRVVPAVVPLAAPKPAAPKPNSAMTRRESDRPAKDQTAIREARLKALTEANVRPAVSSGAKNTLDSQTTQEHSTLRSSVSTNISPIRVTDNQTPAASPIRDSSAPLKAPIVRKRVAPSPLIPIKRRKV